MKLYAVPPFILQNLIWVPTRLTYLFFTHLKIYGFENIKDLPPGVIFALNHSSELDPITLPGSFPFFSRFFPMFYVAREKSFYKNSSWRQAIYGGLFFKMWGAYPAYTGLRDYEKSLINHISILKDNKSICIFPEGHKTRDGALGRARGGVTYLSWATGKPIVPVGISGCFQTDKHNFFGRKKYFTITYGQPIYPRELFARYANGPSVGAKGDDFTDSAQIVMQRIGELLGQPTTKPVMTPAFPNIKPAKKQKQFKATTNL